jgi:hypothetical protein
VHPLLDARLAPDRREHAGPDACAGPFAAGHPHPLASPLL